MYKCKGLLHIKGYVQTTVLYQPPVLALERLGLVMHLLKYDRNVPNYKSNEMQEDSRIHNKPLY